MGRTSGSRVCFLSGFSYLQKKLHRVKFDITDNLIVNWVTFEIRVKKSKLTQCGKNYLLEKCLTMSRAVLKFETNLDAFLFSGGQVYCSYKAFHSIDSNV